MATMLKLITFLVIAGSMTSCSARPDATSDVKSAGNRRGQLRGYFAINQAIKERLLSASDVNATFSIGRYVGAEGNSFEGLAVLFGGFMGTGPANRFRNGQPNAMNTILWDRSLSSLASDLSTRCVVPALDYPLSLHQRTKDLLAKVCTWPSADAKNAMNDLWDIVMGPNDLLEERDAWKAFFTAGDSPYKDAPAGEAVAAMFRAVFLNPYFLLEM